MNFKVFLLKKHYGLKHVTRTDSNWNSMSRLIMLESYSFNCHTVHIQARNELSNECRTKFSSSLISLTACKSRSLVVTDSEHSNKLYIGYCKFLLASKLLYVLTLAFNH